MHYLSENPDDGEARLELLRSQVQNLDESQLLEFIAQLETAWYERTTFVVRDFSLT